MNQKSTAKECPHGVPTWMTCLECLKAEDEALQPGPTGSYPEGQLNAADEGGIRLRVATLASGKIIMDFGKQIAWIGFDPVHARALAKSLEAHADAAEAVLRGRQGGH